MTTPPRSLPTPREFAALDRVAQLDALRRATARQKLRLLIEVADGDALLASLPPQDVYLMARELGPDQVPELLAMASAEQWTAFFDFDCWDRDAFDAGAARSWLKVLLEGEPSRVAATLQELDFELLVLLLHRDVQVLSGPEELFDEEAMAENRRRDAGYVLDYRDEEGAKLYGALLAVLFDEAPGFCRYLLEAVRAEGESLLEESVYQQRAGRLLDQGLPEPQEARRVYAWLDPDGFAIAAQQKLALGGSASGVAPGAVLQLARPRGLLAGVLATGVDAGLAWELACLANKVIMAERLDLGELEQVRGAVERSFAILNLALEHLAGDDIPAAGQILHDAYVEELFRLGFSLTLRLQRRARVVQESPVGPYLDPPWRALVDALLQPSPQFPLSLAEPERSGLRSFASRHDLHLVEKALGQLESQQRLFTRHLPFALPAPGEWQLDDCHPARGVDLTLATIFLTALANRLLERPFVPTPVPGAELATLHGLVTRQGGVDPVLRQQTLAWLERQEAGCGEFGTECLARWEEGFCAIDPAALDPRFVDGLIVRGG